MIEKFSGRFGRFILLFILDGLAKSPSTPPMDGWPKTSRFLTACFCEKNQNHIFGFSSEQKVWMTFCVIIILAPVFLIYIPAVHAHNHIIVDLDNKFVKNGKKAKNLWTSFETGANVKALAFEGSILWMGMPNGLIKYDTNTLNSHTIYTSMSTGGGLLSNGIFAIKIDGHHNKWIGTYGGGATMFDGRDKWITYSPMGRGDSRVYGDTWVSYGEGDGLADLWVYDFLFDNDKMLVATWKGVSIFDGNKFVSYGKKDGLIDKWVYSLAKDSRGRFWFGTEGGVTRFSKKGWKSFTHKDGLGATIENKDKSFAGSVPKHHSNLVKSVDSSNPNYVLSLVIDDRDNKWFGTWGAGLTRFDGKTWKTYTKKDGLGGNYVHILAIDHEGILWAGTDGGISFLINGKWHNYSTDDGLIDNNIFSIAFDDKGGRWFGGWTGLSKLQVIYP